VDFSLSADQAMIKDSVDRFIADAYSFDVRTKLAEGDLGFSREHWRTFAELGWLGIAFPEDCGGFGGTPVETMILMEAFGKGLVLEPFVPSVVIGGSALAFGATTAAHRELLEGLIGGEVLLAPAYAEEGSGYDPAFVETRARRDGGDFIVDGAKRAVPYAAAADRLVVSVRTRGDRGDAAGITVVLVDANAAGVTRRDYRTVDGGRASDVSFSGVRVPAEAVLGEADAGLPLLERALDHGLGALAAEAVGIMSFMQRTTVEYLKVREQFGVPIGSFQALQHRAVDMLIQLELARSMCFYGTMALVDDADARSRAKALSATKVQVARSGRYVGQQAIQLHGGIGMSEEYAIGHYFKRMSMLELALGDVAYHLRRYVHLGRDLGDRRGSAIDEPVAAGIA
jgi:alkylation response protein AidB-like acyl-CoA dehydrogenase